MVRSAVLLGAISLRLIAADVPLAGNLLVASRSARDPDLSKTVVLLLHSDEQGAIGVILNHRTDVPLSRVLPAIADLKAASNPVYMGGPVAVGVRALFRERSKPVDAFLVVSDIYAGSSTELIRRYLTRGAGPDTFRVYAGYVGWSPEQLRTELNARLWFVIPGDAAAVFDPHPESLWQRRIPGR